MSQTTKKKRKRGLGRVSKTCRGFELIEFRDRNGDLRRLHSMRREFGDGARSPEGEAIATGRSTYRGEPMSAEHRRDPDFYYPESEPEATKVKRRYFVSAVARDYPISGGVIFTGEVEATDVKDALRIVGARLFKEGKPAWRFTAVTEQTDATFSDQLRQRLVRDLEGMKP